MPSSKKNSKRFLTAANQLAPCGIPGWPPFTRSLMVLMLDPRMRHRKVSRLANQARKLGWLVRWIFVGCFHPTSDYESDPPLDDEKSLEKVSTLNGAVSQLASDFDRDSNLCLERFSRTRRASVISTGSLKLDLALGIGGLPKVYNAFPYCSKLNIHMIQGRMVEIFGQESSGKTTLALHVIKEAQKNGENAFNTSFAEEIGVDIDKLLIAQPDSAENSLSIVNTLVGGSIDVVVVDSVAALIPKCELEGEIYMKFKDAQSRLMTRALRKIQYTLSRSETLIIFVNQVRTKRSSDASSGIYKEVTCGGNALGFYSAIRMRTSRRKLHYSEDEATGISIAVQIIKNKLVPAALTSAEPGFSAGS
uniref:DNA repair protein recA-like protein, mitochondrial n=1 Tax=Aegilops tauschii TaxID=37682 RepID=N1QW79_AEGTA